MMDPTKRFNKDQCKLSLKVTGMKYLIWEMETAERESTSSVDPNHPLSLVGCLLAYFWFMAYQFLLSYFMTQTMSLFYFVLFLLFFCCCLLLAGWGL